MAKNKTDTKDKKPLNPNARLIDVLTRSRHPIVYIQTHEEERALKDILEIAKQWDKVTYTWDCVNGIKNNNRSVSIENNATDPVAVLEFIKRNIDDAEKEKDGNSKQIGNFFVLCDYFRFLTDPVDPKIERQLRIIATDIVRVHANIIIISPEVHIPAALDKCVSVIDYNFPDAQELGAHLDNLIENVRGLEGFSDYKLNPDQRENVVRAAQGLTLREADNAFSKSLVETRTISDIKIIEEKKQIIRKNGLLEFYEHDAGMSSIGGMQYMVSWLKKRRESFTDKAREYGLPLPSGILLMGVQGCGKSLAAKATANEWHMPLLRLDIGRIFGGFVGDSERNIRTAIKIAESVSPAILWLDEVDKGISGVQSSGQTDGGTTSRVYGTLLTWLQEKRKAVFVIATANNISRLDPAFLRRGRFDEIFFIDLPSADERIEIAKIHLNKRHRNPDSFDLNEFSKKTDQFSGAEIESCIVDALHEGFHDGAREITTDDLVFASENIHPLSEVMAAQLTEIRDWAKTRAKNASHMPRRVKHNGSGERAANIEIG